MKGAGLLAVVLGLLSCGGSIESSGPDGGTPGTCAGEVGRVQGLCAGKPYVQYVGDVCVVNPDCAAACLAQITTLDSCAQIDCSFCPVCDCEVPTTPSPLFGCIASCRAQ